MTTLDDLIRTSLKLGDRTKELYRDCVKNFVTFAGADPSKYDSVTVELWLFELRKERLPQTVNVYRKAIRYASKRWHAHKLGPDFAAEVERISAPKSAARTPLTWEEMQKLIATCANDRLVDIRDRALIVLALRTGIRRGGICSLELAGIVPPRITTRNKGGNPLSFEADAETFALLDAWTAQLRAAAITKGPVFLRIRKGKLSTTRMSPNEVWRVFSKRAKAAKIRHVFPHLARHTTVTMLREAGKSSAEVGQLTGQSERTIENIYTHVRTQGAVSDALPSMLPPPKKADHDPDA